MPLAFPIALAALTVLHEDVAIAAGAGLVSAGTLDFSLTATALLAGIIGGDCLIYSLGLLSTRVARLRRYTERPAFSKCRSALENNLLATLITARLVPGVLFPMYFACGAIRVRFDRFLLTTLATAVLHVGILLALLTSSIGLSSGDVSMAGLALAAVLVGLRTRHGRALVGKATGLVAPDFGPSASGGAATTPEVRLPGMPVVPAGYKPIGLAERIPPLLFYVPLVLQWFALGLRHRSLTLPTAANPSIEAGGLLGESKIRCLELIGPAARHWAAQSTAAINDGAWSVERLEAMAAEAGLSFPLVAKPDIGWRGFGVRLVRDAGELQAYLREMPQGCGFILQAYVPYAGEAGIFYARPPGQARGTIFSLTLRYYPHVVGDGVSTLERLIAHDPRASWKAKLHRQALRDRLGEVPPAGAVVRLALVGSSRVGGLYKDGHALITPALVRRFDEIADAMPGFHFGRFDVRFASAEALAAGEDFRIIEVNGAGAEAIHVWDPEMPLRQVYAGLFHQQALMFAIAAANRARGFLPLSLRGLIGYQQRQQRLLCTYPASN
ncbi:VTT domain-containing protein [Azospirillum sp. sgz302134]